MSEKLALKRLTASDLTFFEWHFKNRNAGNQKAINLNADVFAGRLYPAVETVARQSQNKLGVDLWIGGPGAASPHNYQRKIIKGAAYKNWRLDGEVVYNPETDPERFNGLRPGDLALLGFDGDLVPNTMHLVLVAKSAPEDSELFTRLDELLADRRMAELQSNSLRELCEALSLPRSHPAWLLLAEEDLTEAALGQAPAIARLLTRPRPRRVSLEDLQTARRTAEELGRLGESLVDVHLEQRRAAGEIAEYEWTAEINAISPYDFRLRRDRTWEKLEVKTTAADFDREYHLPLSELREAVYAPETYRIARVYDATSSSAKMRISEDFRPFAHSILGAFSDLPAGVTPDGVSIVPDDQVFGEEIFLLGPSDSED